MIFWGYGQLKKRKKKKKKEEGPNDYWWGVRFTLTLVPLKGKGKARFFGERKQKEKSACFRNGKNFCKKKEQRVGMKWRRRRRRNKKQETRNKNK